MITSLQLLFLSSSVVALNAFSIADETFSFQNPGVSLFRKTLKFHKLGEPIRAEIERLAKKTVSKVAEFEMSIPPKIAMIRMDNEPENTFNEPFLVGDSHQVRAYHYTSQVLSDWCSGIVSGRTHLIMEHKNRWIHVDFDCNRTTVLPVFRFVIAFILILLFVNLLATIRRMNILQNETSCDLSNDDNKRFDESSDFCITSDDGEEESEEMVEDIESLFDDSEEDRSHFLGRLDNFDLPPRKHLSFAVFDDSSLFV